MKHSDNRVLDFLGALIGVSCIDWDGDFADDGYSDFWGLVPLGEPLFLNDSQRKAHITLVKCGAAGEPLRRA
ncbi:MAG: hypothetical protein RR998_01600 [Oscillospiraceae bacterium]